MKTHRSTSYTVVLALLIALATYAVMAAQSAPQLVAIAVATATFIVVGGLGAGSRRSSRRS